MYTTFKSFWVENGTKYGIIVFMSSRKQKILESMRNSPKSVKYADLEWLCNEEFGSARQKGSHRIWNSGKKPDSRITLQPDGKNAKPYQVRQVLKALLG